MEVQIKVLDHGYVKFIEKWGGDERIIEAARMSTAKGFLGWGQKHTDDCFRRPLEQLKQPCSCPAGDEKLLKYLYENKHETPFEFAGLVLEVQAPIFVFREWHRHRTQSYNEMSARYTPLPDFNYLPSIERLMMNSKGQAQNKQAGTTAGAAELTEEAARFFQQDLQRQYKEAQDLYEHALQWGVPKELARVHLPVARYSRMRAHACLRNWLGFLTLRSDKNPGAQWEIRQYANAVGEFVRSSFPRTWELFNAR